MKEIEESIEPLDEMVAGILPAIRMLLSNEPNRPAKIALFRNDASISRLCKDAQSFEEASATLSPDVALYFKSRCLFVERSRTKKEAIADFREKLAQFQKDNDVDPTIILLKGLGMIFVGDDYRAAMDSFKFLVSSFKFQEPETINLKPETCNLKPETINLKLKNKIIVVTGGAQGFGGGIAERMMSLGVNLVVADLNEEAGMKMVEKLNASAIRNRAVFIRVDVSNAESVQRLMTETVKHFGGLDAFISNAGILRAGGLDEMTPETFDLMTKVNYAGYFLCAKYASEVLKLQAKYKPGYFTDIIQINSKSGLTGSNRNFAYAGGKFGGIGLTQSFALELMPFGIKVNSVCPGNFFDGPLWSEPETGLFVQYLRAGKVPGAKTVDDVKAHYEAQVPAKRGCTVDDVMKAILYVIDQEYETGQAVPVTGGQNMLN